MGRRFTPFLSPSLHTVESLHTHTQPAVGYIPSCYHSSGPSARSLLWKWSFPVKYTHAPVRQSVLSYHCVLTIRGSQERSESPSPSEKRVTLHKVGVSESPESGETGVEFTRSQGRAVVQVYRYSYFPLASCSSDRAAVSCKPTAFLRVIYVKNLFQSLLCLIQPFQIIT